MPLLYAFRQGCTSGKYSDSNVGRNDILVVRQMDRNAIRSRISPAQPLLRCFLKEINALGDSDRQVRYQAAFALAEVDAQLEQPVLVLIEALEDSSWITQIHACDALILLGPHGRAAVPSLLQRLAVDSDVGTKERAAQALGKVRGLDAQQVEQLARSLRDNEIRTRRWHALRMDSEL